MPTKRKGRKKKVKRTWELGGITFKSREELWFAIWCEECKDAGIIEKWEYESPTFVLSENVQYMGKQLDQSKSITPDFSITWDRKYKNKMYYTCSALEEKSSNTCLFIVYNSSDCDSNISYIEVKPVSEIRNSSSVSFPYKRSWLLNSQGIWVQKVKPFGVTSLRKGDIGGLFKSTFTPTKIIKSGELKSNKGEYYKWVKWKIIKFNDWFKTL